MRIGFLDFLLIAAILGSLVIAPYTKVEESFNMQAIHDILFYGSDFEKYDHNEFPGVVPRTFVGALVLGVLTKPVQLIGLASKFDLQIASRAVLGLLNAFSLIKFRRTVSNAVTTEGNARTVVSTFMGFLYLSQFHMIFYASRPLPNMIVLPLVTLSYSWIIQGSVGWALTLLSFSSIVFRSELAILTGCIFLAFVVTRKVPITTAVFAGLSGVAIGAALSIAIDDRLWNVEEEYPMIPEIKSFIFNVLDEQSSDWGTEPYTAYVLNHLPNLLNNRLLPVLIPLSILYDKTNSKNVLRLLTIASVAYVLIYSYLPHKEWRFIVYTVPVFTAACAGLLGSLSKASVGWFLILSHLTAVTVILGFGLMFVKMWSSAYNYPGGVALKEFHDIIRIEHLYANGYPVAGQDDPIVVHMDVTTCMTGADRFGQLYDEAAKSLYPNIEPIVYDKTEDDTQLAEKWSSFDYLITSADSNRTVISSIPGYCWKKVGSAPAFNGINTRWAYSVFKSLKDHPEMVVQQIAMSEDRKAEIWSIIRPIVMLRDYVFIYKKVSGQDCLTDTADEDKTDKASASGGSIAASSSVSDIPDIPEDPTEPPTEPSTDPSPESSTEIGPETVEESGTPFFEEPEEMPPPMPEAVPEQIPLE